MSPMGIVVVVGGGTVVVTGSVVVVVGVVVVDDVVVVSNSPPGEQAMMTVARMKTKGTQRIIGTGPEARSPVPQGCCQLGLWRAVPGSRVTEGGGPEVSGDDVHANDADTSSVVRSTPIVACRTVCTAGALAETA